MTHNLHAKNFIKDFKIIYVTRFKQFCDTKVTDFRQLKLFVKTHSQKLSMQWKFAFSKKKVKNSNLKFFTAYTYAFRSQ